MRGSPQPPSSSYSSPLQTEAPYVWGAGNGGQGPGLGPFLAPVEALLQICLVITFASFFEGGLLEASGCRESGPRLNGNSHQREQCGEFRGQKPRAESSTQSRGLQAVGPPSSVHLGLGQLKKRASCPWQPASGPRATPPETQGALVRAPSSLTP